MDAREHPLRRRYALELALGIAVLLLAAWLLLHDEPRAGSSRRTTGGEVERPAEAEVERLAAPEALRELGAGTPARREDPREVRAPAVPLAEALDVLVVDAFGAPAPGVPLTAQLETERGPRGLNGRRPELETDAAGRVRVEVRRFETPERLAGMLEEHPRNVLRACVPLRDAPRIDFGMARPAPGPVTLVLPPCGRVRVRVNEDDGTPVARGASVEARVRDAFGKGLEAVADVHDGVAEFPWIDVGVELELRAFYDDQHTRPSARARLTRLGPRQAGETVEDELFLGLEWPRIAFRAVDEKGAPLAFASLRLLMRDGTSSVQDARCIVDRGGRGELRLMSDHRSAEVRTLELTLPEPVARSAQFVLPAELARGRATELGDLALPRTR